jgi:glutaredoxin
MFTVYSKDACTFCERTKQLLDINDLPYHELKLDRDITRDNLLEAIEYYGHGRTMPMIIHEDGHGNKQRLGGFEELSKWIKENI